MGINKEKYKQEQFRIRQLIDMTSSLSLSQKDIIFTLDIQYQDDLGYVAVDMQQYDGIHLGIHLSKQVAKVEYVPGYFAFREGPLLEAAVQDAIIATGYSPTLMIVDGHGTAHPRGCGVASWLGVRMDIPTIGLAKEPLVKTPYKGMIEEKAGSTIPVAVDGISAGYVLRTADGINPVFVSAGHRITQDKALEIVFALRQNEYRIIEPMRRADHAAREFAKAGGLK